MIKIGREAENIYLKHLFKIYFLWHTAGSLESREKSFHQRLRLITLYLNHIKPAHASFTSAVLFVAKALLEMDIPQTSAVPMYQFSCWSMENHCHSTRSTNAVRKTLCKRSSWGMSSSQMDSGHLFCGQMSLCFSLIWGEKKQKKQNNVRVHVPKMRIAS